MERDFETAGTPHLVVQVAASTVTVDQGDVDRVGVRIDSDDPDHWTIASRGNTIVVRDDRNGMRLRQERVHVTIPVGSDVDLATASGDVTVTVDVGRADIATASGDIRLAAVGTLGVRTASGGVTVGAVAGDLSAKSAAGDLDVDSVEGSLKATTASGDVHAAVVRGPVRITTAAGGIVIDRFDGSSLRVKTMAGDVTVGVASGSTVDLDVNTLTGRVDLPPPRDADAPAPDRPRRVAVNLRSVSGNLTLLRAD